MKRPLLLIPAACAAVLLFFAGYLPPRPAVHIPYDLEGFHYPLADYALQAFEQGRFPEWDAAIYSGQSFAANPQAALFYPPLWLVWIANLATPPLNPLHLELLVFAHLALALLLCFVWLSRTGLRPEACALGAMAYALSGYPLTQLQHLGLICAYAWLPLAFLAFHSRHQFILLTIASALCFLAGYPPAWFVFAFAVFTYSRFAPRVLGALAFSLILAMVQLLPALEASLLKHPEARYGTGLRDPAYFFGYLTPLLAPGRDYLYLGAPALLALAGLCWKRPPLRLWLTFAGAAVLLTNPFGLIGDIVNPLPVLQEICRDWYFLSALSAVLAAFIAHGAHGLLERFHPPRWLVIAFLIAAFAEYRYFGIAKPFDSAPGDPRETYSSRLLPAVDPEIARQLARSPHRVLLDQTAPFPTDARLYGFTTPQGFDPFLTTSYRDLLAAHAHARTNRLYDFRLDDSTLQLFGVRYVITTEHRPLYLQLIGDPRFRVLEPNNAFYRVFEYLAALPPHSPARVLAWTPELRRFGSDTGEASLFHLAEQRWPGWSATIDGAPAAIEPWQTAFQAIRVPAGQHTIEFRFRSLSLRIGACVSALALAVFLWIATRAPTPSTSQTPPYSKSKSSPATQ